MKKTRKCRPLLIIGMLKCGTTSLSRHLAHHPEVSTPIAKELYYFVDEGSSLVSMQNVINKLAFGKDVTSEEIGFDEYFEPGPGQTYIMDATPFSYSQQCAIDFMKKHPEGRVIFMLRDPARRLMSSFRFFQGMYQEYPDSEFDEFTNALLNIGQTRDPYRARIDKDFFKELFDSEIEMGRYVTHIRRWQSQLPAEQIFIGTMEQLRDDPAVMMSEICGFLGVSDSCYEAYDFQPFMQSYKVRYSWLQKIGRRVGKEDPMRFDRISRFQNPFHRIPLDGVRTTLETLYKKIQHADKGADFSQSFALLDAAYQINNVELFAEYGIDYRKDDFMAETNARQAAE